MAIVFRQPYPGGGATTALGALTTLLQTFQQVRQQNQQQQLQALSLLARQPGQELVPASLSEANTGNFLDSLLGLGSPDNQVFRVGNTAFRVQPRARLDPFEGLGLTGAPTAATAAGANPLTSTVAPSYTVRGYQEDQAPTRPLSPAPTPTPEQTAEAPTLPANLKPEQQKYATLAAQIALREGVPARFVPHFVANIATESRFDPRALSKAGAKGLGQLMDATAARYRVADSYDPETNLVGSARYFKDLLDMFNQDPRLAVAAYNAGEEAVQQYGNTVPPYPETQRHVERVFAQVPQYLRIGQATPEQTAPLTADTGAAAPTSVTTAAPQPPPPSDRQLQLAERAQAANPDAELVNVPGVGKRPKAWLDAYVQQLRSLQSLGLYNTPENKLQLDAERRRIRTELDTNQAVFEKNRKEAIAENPGFRDQLQSAQTPDELRTRLNAINQVAGPQQLAQAATTNLASFAQTLPRDAQGTLTPDSLQRYYAAEQYWRTTYGITDATLKGAREAASIPIAEAAAKERAVAPIQTAEAVNRERQLGPVRTAEEVAKTEALASPKAKTAAQEEAARLQARGRTLEDVERTERSAIAEALGRDGLRVEDWGTLSPQQQAGYFAQGRQIQIAQAQQKDQQVKQARFENAPLESRASEYFHPVNGNNPSGGLSAAAAERAGYVHLSQHDQQQWKNNAGSQRYVQRMRTLLLGGPKEDVDEKAKPDEYFPGILPALNAPENAGVLQRLGRGIDVRKAVIAGSTIGEWAKTYDQLKNGLLGQTSRGIGGEVGRIPAQVEFREAGLIPDVGLTQLLSASPSQAEKMFGQLQGILKDRQKSLVGIRPSMLEGVAPPTSAPPSRPETPEEQAAREAAEYMKRFEPSGAR